MKTFAFSLAILAATFSACNDNSNSGKADAGGDTVAIKSEKTTSTTSTPASADEAVAAYLQVKNALTTDNGNEAAEAGKQLVTAMQKLEGASFSDDQKKVYDDVKAEINEHAEHISTNAGKIAHQREHFDMLSADMYDLVKSVKPTQTLYKDHCPMFNDNKGAVWLSETKEISNPYYGKKMLTCGKMQEEIK